MEVRVLSWALDNQNKIVYDCLISGVSSAVERYPSKLDVVGSIPIPRSWSLSPYIKVIEGKPLLYPYEIYYAYSIIPQWRSGSADDC